jgi:CO/xanthine dehydrogenase FAD-binding subunit
MPAFDLLQPGSAAEAQRLLQDLGEDAWVMAGGLDSFDWLKDRIKKPKVLVDLSGVDELKGIRETSDGVEIGAMTTLTEIANHPAIQKNYSVLAQAVSLVASPQIRNQGTLGGNVSQALLSRRRKYLLRRYAGGAQPRACNLRRGPLRCSASLRFRTGAHRAGCKVRAADAQGRARCGRGRLFRWPRD